MANSRTSGRGLEILAALAVGPLAAILPVLLAGTSGGHPSPLVPLLRAGVEEFSLLSLGILILLGVILGVTTSRTNTGTLGLASVLLFPLIAVAEMVCDPTSHNLWPIEFGFYGLGGLIAIGTVAFGRWLKKRQGS